MSEEQQAECRICFESEGTGRFLQPCLCSGTMKYIHQSCWKHCGYICATCKFPSRDVYEERALEFLRNGLEISQHTPTESAFFNFVTIPTGLFRLQRLLKILCYHQTAWCAGNFAYLWIGTTSMYTIFTFSKSLLKSLHYTVYR